MGKLRQVAGTFLTSAVIAYAVIVVALTLGQQRFVYPAPRSAVEAPAGFTPVSYTSSDGLRIKAGYRPAAGNAPTIVFFHGNGTSWSSTVPAVDRLTAAGFGVLAAEYRGYGGNPGQPAEQALYRDGRAALDWLDQQGVSPDNIVLIGNSIGSGVATQLAVEREPKALVLISPFASLTQVAAEEFWWLPVSLLLRDRYANVDKIDRISAPILLLHGDVDDLIPDHHSYALARANPAAKLLIVPGAGHDLAWRDEAKLATLTFLEEIHAADRLD